MAVPNPAKIFIDTGGFIALIYKQDPKHEIAVYYYSMVVETYRLFTTNMIISETYTWLRYHTSHLIAVKFLDLIYIFTYLVKTLGPKSGLLTKKAGFFYIKVTYCMSVVVAVRQTTIRLPI